MGTMTVNIVTVIAEVSLVIIVIFLLDWSFSRLYRQLFRLPILKKWQKNATIARRNVRGFLFLIGFLLSLGLIGGNGYLIYRGENVLDYSLNLIQQIPREFWQALGFGIVKSIGAIIFVSLALRFLNPKLEQLARYVKDFDSITANDESIITFFKTLKSNINTASWLAIAILCAQFLFIPSIIAKYLYILLRIYIIIAIGLLILKVVTVIIDSLDALTVKYSSPDNLLQFYDRLQHLVPFFKRCLEYIIYVTMATLVIQQVEFVADLAEWGPIGIKLIAIVLLSRILISVLNLVVVEVMLNAKGLTPLQQQQRKTITPLIQSIAKYCIYFGSGIIMLYTVRIDPGPILAGAGILGLAVGLGAQNLINDVVSGFFIFFENYYLVGDYIEAEEASGYVEAIELRTTRIRHYNGQVYIVRNGDIASIVNYSKEFVYATIDLGVDYDTDLDRVYKIIETVGRNLKEENDNILESTEVAGIKEFGEIRLSIHTRTKVKPGTHFELELILRRAFKEAFDREEIYIPVAEMADKPSWATKAEKAEENKFDSAMNWSIDL
ncbi:MAG: mechanosensitive ion channel family protein [Cyanobacteria bacterium P01_E01_bin.42]